MARSATEKPMIRHLALTKARTNLGEVVERVHRNKEYVILEKGGLPVAAMMDIDEFEDYLELHDPEVEEHVRTSSEEFGVGESRAAGELVRELRDQVREQEEPATK
ncbi:MAG: type II toxin-antitoxin system Phd/YefM family antitoxin [Rhodospirillales bacterium]|nr:type II toxin-antitoxin system Phd/YefM family antitoxin [Rhodospirillales bacterium]